MTEQSSEELLVLLAAIPADTPDHRALRERIIVDNLPLVRYLARGFVSEAATFDDLVQVGSVGLMKAVDRFDSSVGKGFAAYAAPTIIGEIRRYLRDSHRLVRAPRRAFELQSAVARARDSLSQELGRSPTLSEIGERVGVSPEEVVETLEVVRSRDHDPLDRSDTEADGPIHHLVAVEEPGYDSAEARIDLRPALATLSESEQRVIRLRFVEGRTQRDIAEEMGVSQMQISRLIQRSLLRMRGVLDDPDAAGDA